MNPQLSSWGNFYMIVGSSGAALIGIQFVVITLVAEMSKITTTETISAFGTPTVAHLGGALVISAIMSAPWAHLLSLSMVLALCGFAGLAYGVIVSRRARRQTGYKPVPEDWLWDILLPGVLYAALTGAALLLHAKSPLALFFIAAVALGLLLIGIHNAWDTVTYVVMEGRGQRPKRSNR